MKNLYRAFRFFVVLALALPALADNFLPPKSGGGEYTPAEVAAALRAEPAKADAALAAAQAFYSDLAEETRQGFLSRIGEGEVVTGANYERQVPIRPFGFDPANLTTIPGTARSLGPDEEMVVDSEGHALAMAETGNPPGTNVIFLSVPVIGGPRGEPGAFKPQPGPLGQPPIILQQQQQQGGGHGDGGAGGHGDCAGYTGRDLRECHRHLEEMERLRGRAEVQVAQAYGPKPSQEGKWAGAVFPFGFYSPSRVEAWTSAPTLTNAPTRVDSHDRWRSNTDIRSNTDARDLSRGRNTNIRNFPPPVVVPPVVVPPIVGGGGCFGGDCPPVSCFVRCPRHNVCVTDDHPFHPQSGQLGNYGGTFGNQPGVLGQTFGAGRQQTFGAGR